MFRRFLFTSTAFSLLAIGSAAGQQPTAKANNLGGPKADYTACADLKGTAHELCRTNVDIASYKSRIDAANARGAKADAKGAVLDEKIGCLDILIAAKNGGYKFDVMPKREDPCGYVTTHREQLFKFIKG